jgi:hypothetical protein
MPRLEKRRLQQLRGSSYVLTLPKDWVEEMGLGKGSSVLLLSDPGVFCVVPSDRGGGFAVEIDTRDVGGEEGVEEAVRLFYTLGAVSMRIKSPGASYRLLPRIRRLRAELHGVMATVLNEDEVQVSFSGELFTSLEEGVRSFLVSLATAARAAASYAVTGDKEAVMSEVSECLLQARALSRYVSWMISRPSRDLIIQATPLAGVLSARLIDLCASLEEALKQGISREDAETFASLVSELAESVDKGYEDAGRVWRRVVEKAAATPRDRSAAHQLLRSLAHASEALKHLALMRLLPVR